MRVTRRHAAAAWDCRDKLFDRGEERARYSVRKCIVYDGDGRIVTEITIKRPSVIVTAFATTQTTIHLYVCVACVSRICKRAGCVLITVLHTARPTIALYGSRSGPSRLTERFYGRKTNRKRNRSPPKFISSVRAARGMLTRRFFRRFT